jgi:hypothetical protein
METKDLIKAGLIVFLYCVVAPLAGMLIAGRRKFQRAVFALMCFMTIGGLLGPAEWGFTLGNEPDYRGHARGFHFYFDEMIAMTLIVAALFDRKTKFKLFPPGVWLWLFYIAMSLLSIVNAPQQHYVWMSALKAVKVLLIFIAAFNFIREESDLHFFLTVMSATMIWELLVVLKMKYIDELYQIWGTFEHQNALCMYASMIGMVLLAAGAGAKLPGKIFGVISQPTFYLIGYVATAAIVESTLSRGGIVIFGIGTVGIILWSLYDKISVRRITVVCALAAIAFVGISYSFTTIMTRFHDRYNVDSNETRVRLNKASAAMLKDKPLGVGWNNYAILINPPYHYGDVIDEWFIMHGENLEKGHLKGISESLYWLLLAETGYQGFAVFMIFIAVFLWRNLRAIFFFRRQFLACVSAGIFMGCAMNYVHSLLERVLTQPRSMMLWMILLAVTVKIEMWRREAKKKKRRENQSPQEKLVLRTQAVPASTAANW